MSWLSLGCVNTSDPDFTPTHSHSLWPQVKANWRLTCCLSLFLRPPTSLHVWRLDNPAPACTLEVKGWKKTGGNSNGNFVSWSRFEPEWTRKTSVLTMLLGLAKFPKPASFSKIWSYSLNVINSSGLCTSRKITRSLQEIHQIQNNYIHSKKGLLSF